MHRSSHEFVRHVRSLAALLVAFGAACSSDPMGVPDAQSSATRDVTPAAAPSYALAESPSFASAAEFVSSATTRGTLNVGGPWTLRAGPAFTYTSLGKIASGTAIDIVCTTIRLSSTGVPTLWDRLATGPWVIGTVITPSATAPDCDSPAGPKVIPGLRGNNYPYATDAADSCIWDAWGFCKRQCTSFVAWRLRDVNGIANFRYSSGGTTWGSAMSWASTARTLGYRVDKKPEVGAVAQWNKSSSRPVGHVAWVASVSADGRQVTLEEYNTSVYRGYSKRTVNVSSVDNFLHLY